jgi:hypothetical protein
MGYYFGMIFPEKLPGLKWLTVLTAVYGVVWMGFEGDLGRVILLGTAVSVVGVGHLLGRWSGGRPFRRLGLLVVGALAGLAAGVGSGALTVVFMAVKTGLHGHGPEFRPSEIEGVLRMVPLWGLVGVLAGLGLGLLVFGLRKGTS